MVAVGLLFCWLTPTLLGQREQARRQICSHHLAEVGKALRGFHQDHNHFPPAAVWEIMTTAGLNEILQSMEGIHGDYHQLAGGGPDRTKQNWVFFLLPYFGEESLAQKYHSSEMISAEANREYRCSELTPLRCPSDVYNREDNQYLRLLRDSKPTNYARGNYGINLGPDRNCFVPGYTSSPCPNGLHLVVDVPKYRVEMWGSGIAGINKTFSDIDCPNGTAKLVAVDEIRAGLNEFDSRGVWSLGQIGGSITFFHGQQGDADSPNSLKPRSDDVLGCRDLHQAFGVEKLMAEKMPCCDYINANSQATARSMHPNGVHALFVDGRVQFVHDDVDRGVWHVMHSRENLIDFDLP